MKTAKLAVLIIGISGVLLATFFVWMQAPKQGIAFKNDSAQSTGEELRARIVDLENQVAMLKYEQSKMDQKLQRQMQLQKSMLDFVQQMTKQMNHRAIEDTSFRK